MKAPLPADEALRLKALRGYDILDTSPEQEFDDIALLASQICGAPNAMISLVDEDRQWFKSKIGTTESETSRDIAFCAHGILQPDVFVIEDAQADARFADNPMVTGGRKIRFYAGAPLLSPDGHALGMLCVNDQVPRVLTEEQKAALQALSRQVSALLALRRSVKQLNQTFLQLRDTEEALKRKTAFLEAQVDSSFAGLLVVDPQMRKILQNKKLNELLKIPPHIAEDQSDRQQLEWVTARTKNPQQFLEKVEFLYAHPNEISHDEIEFLDGRILDRYSSPVIGLDGNIYGRIWAFRDISAQKRLETQLFQSQKMETTGKLAGGIAHEFNSLLTAIIGQSEMILGDSSTQGSSRESALEIHKAAMRAAVLTQQLMAYSRKQILQPQILDLNAVLASLEGTLRHLMGQSVNVRIVPAAGLKPVRMDPGQIEQVIVNIAMNAVAAMPGGGKFTLETANVTLDGEYADRYPELKPGEYVMLAMSDTGCGITPEVKEHLFEPFFTTKGVGHGAGLGLATCYGILKQSGGHINVYSEPGRGAAFKIYLPQVEAHPPAPVPASNPTQMPRGVETILLVEDDPSLREMAATLLTRLGYTVLKAGDGLEALNIKHQQAAAHVDLVFTDVVMPAMSGKELADRFRSLYPKTKILFTSAYTGNAMAHQGVLSADAPLLQKPFTPGALARKIREVLDQPAP